MKTPERKHHFPGKKNSPNSQEYLHPFDSGMTGQAARMVQLKLEREDSRLVASPASGAELGGVLSENVRQIFFF